MARKRTDQARGAREPAERSTEQTLEDTAMRSLSKDERRRLAMDSWEPSLLRNMLEAADKLRRGR